MGGQSGESALNAAASSSRALRFAARSRHRTVLSQSVAIEIVVGVAEEGLCAGVVVLCPRIGQAGNDWAGKAGRGRLAPELAAGVN
jgi:hypothetical protein